jgi:hypothetical protein
MVAFKACNARKEAGSACQAPPLKDGDFCVAHSPDHADEMQEARRLGASGGGANARSPAPTSSTASARASSSAGSWRSPS